MESSSSSEAQFQRGTLYFLSGYGIGSSRGWETVLIFIQSKQKCAFLINIHEVTALCNHFILLLTDISLGKKLLAAGKNLCN